MVGLLIAYFEDQPNPVYGTGFLLYSSKDKKRGFIMTCAHNVTSKDYDPNKRIVQKKAKKVQFMLRFISEKDDHFIYNMKEIIIPSQYKEKQTYSWDIAICYFEDLRNLLYYFY
jgi:hypothetical protein